MFNVYCPCLGRDVGGRRRLQEQSKEAGASETDAGYSAKGLRQENCCSIKTGMLVGGKRVAVACVEMGTRRDNKCSVLSIYVNGRLQF